MNAIEDDCECNCEEEGFSISFGPFICIGIIFAFIAINVFQFVTDQMAIALITVALIGGYVAIVGIGIWHAHQMVKEGIKCQN